MPLIIRYFFIGLFCVTSSFGVLATTDVANKTDNVEQYYEIIKQAGWGDNADNPERQEIFNKVTRLLNQKEENLSDLEQNAQDVKANEQSLANRTLGAASMATMGLGAMQAASAKAEKNIYEDVEQDMASYLATFRCDFGTGKRFQGGEKNIQIPGTAELIPLYSEYVNLANDLKARKEQLGMRAGIESEKILDSATTGLYDDVSTGITSGVYASLSRALMNPDGEDAKKWAEMKGETDKNLKQGLTAVGIGAVVGVAGNAIVNAKSPKDKSAQLLAKQKEIESELTTAMKQVIDQCNKEITEAQRVANEIQSTMASWSSDNVLRTFVEQVQKLQKLEAESDIIQIKDHPICR